MNQVLKNFLIVLVIVISWSIGTGAGIYYEKQLLALSLEKAEKLSKDLGSQVIRSTIAFGVVSNISGKTITLVSGKDSLAITIKTDAQILLLVSTLDETGKAINIQQKGVFSDIKKDSKVNVSVKFLANGQAEGSLVTIFPVTPK